MTELNTYGLAVEEWRPVPTVPHVEASSHGRVRYMGPKRRKMQPGHIIPQQNGSGGYKQVGMTLTCDGPAKFKTLKVHRLVALAFHGLPPLSNQAIVVGHLDDDKCNNRPGNLRWMTQRENCNAPRCRAKHRAAKIGENNPFYGRQHSPEARAKMSASQREAAARRRLQAVTSSPPSAPARRENRAA